MRMCKYCGGLVRGSGFGKRGVYCSKACWDAVDGFDRGMALDRQQRGDVSLEGISERGLEISDGGASVEAMLDRLDGVTESERVFERVMDLAAQVHPRLPAAMIQIKNGKTQSDAAASVGWDRATFWRNMSKLEKLVAR